MLLWMSRLTPAVNCRELIAPAFLHYIYLIHLGGNIGGYINEKPFYFIYFSVKNSMSILLSPNLRLSAVVMETFLTRPKRKSTHVNATPEPEPALEDGEESTEIKLAMLSSLNPSIGQETLLDVLLAHDGSVGQASESLKSFRPGARKSAVIGYQQSLRQYAKPSDGSSSPPKKKTKSKKGSTLHLYDPEDVAEHTPCTIIHNFLPTELADELLRELLDEAKSFEQITFKLFENIVASPHTSCLFLESYEKIQEQKHDYYYNGGMLHVSVDFFQPAQTQPN